MPDELPDEARLAQKAPGAYRVIFLGESQLVSVGHNPIDLAHAYPCLLSKLLATVAPHELISSTRVCPDFPRGKGLCYVVDWSRTNPIW